MKIKSKFPTAASMVITDARWLGYHLTNRKDQLTIDPIYIRMLTKVFLTKPKLTLSTAFGQIADIIPQFVDAKNGMIRGNAFPMENTITVAIGKAQKHIIAQSGCDSREANVFTILLLKALAAANIVEIVDGSVVSDLYEIPCPIVPLFTPKVGDSILGHILLADIANACIVKFLDTVEKNLKPILRADKGGFRSADVDSIADAISRAANIFDLELCAARGRIMPYLRSTYYVFCQAITNPSYVPVGMTDADLRTLVSYANAYIDVRANALVPRPTLRDEKHAASCVADLLKALNEKNKNASLCTVQNTVELQRAIEQFSVKMPSDSNVGMYLKTGWLAPNAASFHTAVIIPYRDGVDLVRVDSTLASSVQPYFDILLKLSDYLRENYNRSHLSLDGYTSGPAINQLTDESGYDKTFENRLLLAIALDCSTDFSVQLESGVVSFTYMDATNRHNYTAALGSEVRQRATNLPSEVIAHTSLTQANGETLWKHPSAIGILPAESAYVSGLAGVKKSFIELVGHTDFGSDGSVIPVGSTIDFNLMLPNGSEVAVQFTINSLVSKDVYALADVWLEKDKTIDLVNGRLNALLKEVLMMPDCKAREKFIVDLTRMLAEVGFVTLGDDIYRAMSRYTMFPASYWDDHATQGLKVIRMRNCVNGILAVLNYLKFTSAANLATVAKEAFKLPADILLKD